MRGEHKLLKLIKNEYMKVFLKKSTYVVLGICLILSIGISLLIQYAYDGVNEYYFGETTIEEDMNSYNPTYVWDKVYMEECEILIDLGYEYYSKVPRWILNAVDDAVFNHYAYLVISEWPNIEEAQIEMGMFLEGIDIEYEKKVYEEKCANIKAGNYTEYSKNCLEYMDYQKKNEISYDEQEYIYHTYMVDKNINPETDDNLIVALEKYAYAKCEYDNLIMQREMGVNVSDYDLEQYKKIYTIYQYVVDNEIEHYMTEPLQGEGIVSSGFVANNNKFITAITSNTIVCGMAGIFVMIIAAGIVANEFSNGTIKFLLINPVKRAKIFWSKYITCISLLVCTLVVFYIFYILFCMITCGTEGMGGVYLSYADGVAHEQSIILYSLKQYALAGVSLLTSITLAFTISSLMRSNAIAVAISLVIEFLGATITLFLYEFGHDWARYLVFSNTDLANISNGYSLFPGQTIGFALTVIAIYMVIYLLTAYDAFKKKEV